VEAVRHGQWPVEVAMSAVGLASAVIAFLAFKTLVLAARGKLLPPV
jgi:tellurite resistance protein